MACVVKREKAGPATGLPTPAAVHYAAAVGPAGNVTRWVDEQGAAAVLADDLGQAVSAHYRARPLAGKISVVPDSKPAEAVVKEEKPIMAEKPIIAAPTQERSRPSARP